MLNSKQLIEITGISRATLNNYVALGILPNPVIKTPSGVDERATRLGYFEDDAVERIKQVQLLKKQGFAMSRIAEQLGAKHARFNEAASSAAVRAPAGTIGTGSSVGGQGSPTNSLGQLSLDTSIDDLPGAAYMVNNNFELIWWNQKATTSLFDCTHELPGDLESRNLLKLLFSTSAAQDKDRLKELLLPHVAAGKKRLTQQALIKIYSSLDGSQLSLLKELYEEVEAVGKEPMIHFPIMLVGEKW